MVLFTGDDGLDLFRMEKWDLCGRFFLSKHYSFFISLNLEATSKISYAKIETWLNEILTWERDPFEKFLQRHVQIKKLC